VALGPGEANERDAAQISENVKLTPAEQKRSKSAIVGPASICLDAVERSTTKAGQFLFQFGYSFLASID